MSIRKRVAGALVALALTAFGAGEGHAEAVELTLPQAMAMAQSALKSGNPELAYQLSEGLLLARPEDGAVHFIQAVALSRMGDLTRARRSIRQAYHFAETDADRYQAAKLAAGLAFRDKRPTWSQAWLRRGYEAAATETEREEMVRAFRLVEHENPLKFRLDFALRPSDNVNNGSNSAYNIIDGLPFVGILSSSAQAVPGKIAFAGLSGSYRLARNENSETLAVGRLLTQRVWLDKSTPGLTGEDLSWTVLETGLSHQLATGPKDDTQWALSLTGGRVWAAGDPAYDFAKLSSSTETPLSPRLSFRLRTSLERQSSQDRAANRTDVISLGAGLGYRFDNEGEVRLDLGLSESDSETLNRSYSQRSAILGYTFGKPIGPARLSLSLGQRSRDYEEYRIAIFTVPGGRQDDTVFGSISARFEGLDYMGFIPTVSVRAERNRSNVSRFDVDETVLSIGFRSAF